MNLPSPDFDEPREPDPTDGRHLAAGSRPDAPEPDTKGKPGAGAGPINDPETPPPDAEPDVDAGSQ